MKFKNHRLHGAQFVQAKAMGGKIAPTLVVLHDTASRLEAGSAVSHLKDNPAKVSAHFVIERDGTVVQMVPINRRANHAGRSNYHGREHCNGFSIGIEIVNPGRMTLAELGGKQVGVSWYKQSWDVKDFAIQRVKTPEHGDFWWMDYTPEQISALEPLLHALFSYVPSLVDIQPHWYISPGRKVDTNPLFPLDAIRARVLGRDQAAEAIADEAADDIELADEKVTIAVPGASLNMRRWPSFNPNVIATIPDRVCVPVLRKGDFGGRSWLKVRYDGLEGWIVSSYAA